MRIAVGSDHAGFPLKRALSVHLEANGHAVLDLGTHSTEAVDYPDGRAVVRVRLPARHFENVRRLGGVIREPDAGAARPRNGTARRKPTY